MLGKDDKNRLMDFFTAPDLIEYLVEGEFISFDTLIDAVETEIEEAFDDLEELMGVTHGNSS